MTPHDRQRLSAGLVAAVMLLLFGGIGVSALVDVGQRLYDGWRVRGWVEAPATLTRWDESGAQYSYTHGGQVFTGRRLGTDRGDSSIDDWNERIDQRLSAAMSGDRKVGAWVNPDRPDEAMLDREVRWKVVATVAFIGAGFLFVGLCAAGFIGHKALSEEARNRLPALRGPARTAFWHWLAALGWNFAAIPIAVLALPAMWSKGEWFPVLMLSIFPIVGLGITWSAVQMTAQALRAGSPIEWPGREAAR